MLNVRLKRLIKVKKQMDFLGNEFIFLNNKERIMLSILKKVKLMEKPYIRAVEEDKILRLQKYWPYPIIKHCGMPTQKIWNFPMLSTFLYKNGWFFEENYKHFTYELTINDGSYEEYPAKYDGPVFRQFNGDIDKYVEYKNKEWQLKNKGSDDIYQFVNNNGVVYLNKKVRKKQTHYGFFSGVMFPDNPYTEKFRHFIFTKKALYTLHEIEFTPIKNALENNNIGIITLKKYIDEIKRYEITWPIHQPQTNDQSSIEVGIINGKNYEYVLKTGKWNDKGWMLL